MSGSAESSHWPEPDRVESGLVMARFACGWQLISPFVTTSVLWSIYSFLRSPDDYMESICTAIAVGGDVDTTAAMTGAISGTLVGLDRLPRELAQQVNDAGMWGHDELVRLAHRYHSVATGEGPSRATL
jgi:ADP-ribosylglycohydrolase